MSNELDVQNEYEENTLTHTLVTSIINPPLGGSMQVAYNDLDDRAGLRGYVQFNKYTHTYTHTHTHTVLVVFQMLL